MGAVETWWCDFHEADSDSDYVQEEEAREVGWVRLERLVPSNVPGIVRRYNVVGHLCPDCLTDPDKRSRVDMEGWRAWGVEDRKRLAQPVRANRGGK